MYLRLSRLLQATGKRTARTRRRTVVVMEYMYHVQTHEEERG